MLNIIQDVSAEQIIRWLTQDRYLQYPVMVSAKRNWATSSSFNKWISLSGKRESHVGVTASHKKKGSAK